jgi:hypothetical protein
METKVIIPNVEGHISVAKYFKFGKLHALTCKSSTLSIFKNKFISF